jgi:hypothetical protein
VNEAHEPARTDPVGDGEIDGAGAPLGSAPGPAVQARVTDDGVILAVDQKGKVFKCLQINCWHCFAKCPRRM